MEHLQIHLCIMSHDFYPSFTPRPTTSLMDTGGDPSSGSKTQNLSVCWKHYARFLPWATSWTAALGVTRQRTAAPRQRWSCYRERESDREREREAEESQAGSCEARVPDWETRARCSYVTGRGLTFGRDGVMQATGPAGENTPTPESKARRAALALQGTETMMPTPTMAPKGAFPDAHDSNVNRGILSR